MNELNQIFRMQPGMQPCHFQLIDQIIFGHRQNTRTSPRVQRQQQQQAVAVKSSRAADRHPAPCRSREIEKRSRRQNGAPPRAASIGEKKIGRQQEEQQAIAATVVNVLGPAVVVVYGKRSCTKRKYHNNVRPQIYHLIESPAPRACGRPMYQNDLPD